MRQAKITQQIEDIYRCPHCDHITYRNWNNQDYYLDAVGICECCNNKFKYKKKRCMMRWDDWTLEGLIFMAGSLIGFILGIGVMILYGTFT